MRKASKKSPILQLPADYSVLSAITKRIHNYQSHQKAIASIPPLMPGSPSSAPSPREVSLFLLRLLVSVVLMNFIIASQEAFFKSKAVVDSDDEADSPPGDPPVEDKNPDDQVRDCLFPL